MTVQLRPATGLRRSRAERCVALLGEELTAYIAGAATVGEFDRWRAARRRRSEVEERLQAAVDVADAFAQANLLGSAAGWLREVGAAGVVDRSPARLLREATGETLKRVLDAAERFIHR